MKKIEFLTLLFVLMFFVFNLSVGALNTGFSTESLPEDAQKQILSKLSLELIPQNTFDDSINCFDVREDGMIAIGCLGDDTHVIKIYNRDMVFQYGYTFKCHGIFGLEWDGDFLMIYFVRSDIIASFDPNGACVEMARIENTTENNSYWNHTVFSTKRETENGSYILQNDMGFLNFFEMTYSQLKHIDNEGNESILYDVNSNQLAKYVMTLIVVLILVIIAVFILVSVWRKIKNAGDGSQYSYPSNR